MLSQFSQEGTDKPVLGELHDFPKDVYPIGRLDADSEGLLLLTNDKRLNHQLLDPKYKHSRTYLVQVDGQVTEAALARLRQGVSITVNKKRYHTLPAKASAIDTPENLPPRNPPIRIRQSIPTSWIKLSLTEGKNRQVRKMTAAAGFPTLRLIRSNIERLYLGQMQPGDVMELEQQVVYEKLGL